MAFDHTSLPNGEHDVDEEELYRQLSTLEVTSRSGRQEDLRTTPLTTLTIKNAVEKTYGDESGGTRMFEQYAVLGFHNGNGHPAIRPNEPILMNVNAPNSAFICGSQGSGKSYTLSCMLENCLVADERIGRVRHPLAGLAFHFDPDSAGGVAETAYLCSMGIPVNVLVSQSNERALRTAYSKIPGAEKNLVVTPLLLRASDLSIERMHRLMAFSDKDGAMPLYMSVVLRILRQMAISTGGGGFDYLAFRKMLEKEQLTKDQLGPLNLRLELLESYLDLSPASRKASSESLLNIKAGSLTIVDLTDPFVDPATACILFDICLSLVKEHRSSGGLVVALDEAHRYMTASLASSSFTERLLGTIREQRHNATRVIIATQEPTVSEKLLDLCSVSIIHRFTSPAWFSALQHHLGAASKVGTSDLSSHDIFQHIMDLSVGESLVFAPSAFLCLEPNGTPAKLGRVAIDMKTRTRLGNDGGMSILTSTHVEPPPKLYESEHKVMPEAVGTMSKSTSNKSKSTAKFEQRFPEPQADEQDDLISFDTHPMEQANGQLDHVDSSSQNGKRSTVSTSKGPTDRGLPPATPTGPSAERVTRSQSSNLIPASIGSSGDAKINGVTPVSSKHMNGKNKEPQSSQINSTTHDSSSTSSLDLSPAKSHMFLICPLCKQMALVEFAKPNLPNLDAVVQKEKKSGLAYTACATCRHKADPTQLEKEQINKFSHGGAGPATSALRKQLQTAACISGGLPRCPVMFIDASGPRYLFATRIEAHIDDDCRLFSIELVKENKGSGVLSLKARPHRREVFFQNVQNAGLLASYATSLDSNDSANTNEIGKGKAIANSKAKMTGSASGKADGKAKAEGKMFEKPEEKASGKASKKANEKANSKADGQAVGKAEAAVPLEMW